MTGLAGKLNQPAANLLEAKMQKHKRICPICEAGCGLIIGSDNRDVIAVEPNRNDVFSTGHMCPKGVSLKELDADPDRLRRPLIRTDGELREATWQQAWTLVNERLNEIRTQYGNDAIAFYIGNPTAHNVGLAMGLGIFAEAVASRNIFSAGSVDQLPKQLASELMFGDDMAIPVPDIERCDLLVMLGANPVVSNGSLWMVPKFREKLRDLHTRGGKLVTVDPRLTETARLADTHLAIIPSTDAWLLIAVINELKLLGCQIPDHYRTRNADKLFASLAAFSIEETAVRTGISADAIRALAMQLREARTAAVYGRIGTTLQQFGTLTSYLVEVVNIMTGNLDRAGGAMFPEQAFSVPAEARTSPRFNRYQSRVSRYPEVMGQMPAVALAEEMETAGEGQIRALVCFAGNPVVSNPDSDRLEAAIQGLDFMICVDIYHNETTRLADVILPGSSPFEEGHYDSFLGAMGYRNSARYSPPLFESAHPSEWEIGMILGYVAANKSVPTTDELRAFEDNIVAASVSRYAHDATGALHHRDVQEIMALIGPDSGVERLLDLGIRAGQWGDHFGTGDGLTLQKLIDEPDGIDFGPIRDQRLAELMDRSFINLGADEILHDIEKLRTQDSPPRFQMIGRRSVNSNNSWLRNLPMLGKGRKTCVLEVHPTDASELGIKNGETIKVSSPAGSVLVEVAVTDKIRQGVVSLPHGFSEDKLIDQKNAIQGANYNRLVSTDRQDSISATAALNGFEVTLSTLSIVTST